MLASEQAIPILDEAAPYLANLASLWTMDPELARRVEAVPDEALGQIEPAKSGDPTAFLVRNGRPVYLHSRYKPREEADRLADAGEFNGRFVCFIHGMGLGYLVDAAFDRAGEETIICVFEPDLAVLKTAFMARDLSARIESGRLVIHTSPDKGEFFQRMTPNVALVTSGVVELTHALSLQLNPAYFEQSRAWVKELTAFASTSINTLV